MTTRRRANGKLGSAEGAASRRALPPALRAHCWRPGQSGNPGGLSGAYGEAMRLAQQAAPDAVRRLIELMESDDERVAAVACNAILDRAFGKPREAPRRTRRRRCPHSAMRNWWSRPWRS
jgi:hypothetical protein